MPQLDTLTFKTQVLWFLIIYTVFYIIVAYVYLPRLTSLLTLRADSYNMILQMTSEVNFLLRSYYTYVALLLHSAFTKNVHNISTLRTEKHFNKLMLSLQKTYLLKTMENQQYLISK